jgi:hypothetical protein
MPWPHSRIRTRQLQHRPTCAVCKVPVASFTEYRDEFIDRVVFTVQCHGATEVASTDCATADRIGAITWGSAFAAPLALPAPLPDCWAQATPDEIRSDLRDIAAALGLK